MVTLRGTSSLYNKDGMPTLKQGVAQGQIASTSLVRSQGDQLLLKFKGKPSLIDAVLKNDLDIVKHALEQGADVSTRDEDGKTALFHLFRHPQPNKEVFNLLLAQGIDVNATNRYGETALYKLCKKENMDLNIFKTLTNKTSDLNKKNVFGDPLLHELVGTKTPNLEAIRHIISKIDINERNRYGRNALHILMAQEKPNETAIKLLLDNKADKNAKDVLGRTPLDCYKEWFPDSIATLKSIERIMTGSIEAKNSTDSKNVSNKNEKTGLWGYIKKTFNSFMQWFKSLFK
jgi:ankyrin repeat protein